MARDFNTMATNVGRTIGDTGDTTKTFINTYLNNRYFDIANRLDWSVMTEPDYTLTSTASVRYIALPSDFDSEFNVVDTTNGESLVRMTQQEYLQMNASNFTDGDADPTGEADPTGYYISRENSRIYFNEVPSRAIVYLMPYKKRVTEMTADSDTVAIRDIEWIMEIGSIADAWAYKRQLQKSSYYESRYEDALQRRIQSEVAQYNQIHQFIPAVYPERECY